MGYFSNGTEGLIFEEDWCSRCIHSDIGPGREIGVDPPCPVWMAHLLFAYEECNNKSNAKTILGMLIEHKTIKASDGYDVPLNECAMFAPHDAGCANRGQLAIEMAA